jgi:hypothetical protein
VVNFATSINDTGGKFTAHKNCRYSGYAVPIFISKRGMAL